MLRFPVNHCQYINKDLSLCFEPNRSPIDDRIFILTVPKSGTYLIAKIFENFGIVNCGVHVATDIIQDNRFADEQILRVQPGIYTISAPLDISVDLICPGQFAFGHIPCSKNEQSLLGVFRKVFSFRDLRDVIISLVRYYESRKVKITKPERLVLYEKFKELLMGSKKMFYWFELWGSEIETLIRYMSPWKDCQDVFQLKFEVLMGDYGKEHQISLLNDLCRFVGLDIDEDKIEEALRDSIGSDTLTYSGKRSSYSQWWNNDIDELYRSYGYEELNKAYGYK